jgi:glucose dehydrogenase
VLTTASDLVFAGGREGYFYSLDAVSGALLWKSSLGSAPIRSGPITYEVDGQQFVTIIAGHVLAAYGLRE